MDNLVQSFTAEGNGAIHYTTKQFAVTEAGDYHFGIRATNIATQTTVISFTVYYYENNSTGPVDTPYTEDLEINIHIRRLGKKRDYIYPSRQYESRLHLRNNIRLHFRRYRKQQFRILYVSRAKRGRNNRQ